MLYRKPKTTRSGFWDALQFVTGAGSRTSAAIGQLFYGDTSGDFYRIGNLATGTQIDLTYTNTENSSVSPKLWLYESSGNTIIAEGAEGVPTLSHQVLADGDYAA